MSNSQQNTFHGEIIDVEQIEVVTLHVSKKFTIIMIRNACISSLNRKHLGKHERRKKTNPKAYGATGRTDGTLILCNES